MRERGLYVSEEALSEVLKADFKEYETYSVSTIARLWLLMRVRPNQ